MNTPSGQILPAIETVTVADQGLDLQWSREVYQQTLFQDFFSEQR